MNKTNKLEHVKNTLEEYGFVCELKAVDADVPFARLLVSLGKDDQGRERSLVVRMDRFPLSGEPGQADQEYLHLFSAFPCTFEQQALGDLSRLLLSLNKPLEIPGFGLDEANGLIFFRYSLIPGHGSIKERTLLAMVSTIMLLMDALSPQIEAVARGVALKTVLQSTFAQKAA